MPIVVEHQPAFAAPGMMAAQTGQLEYRNQRRRELEAIAMQQAEMAQRARMQRENIAAGFMKQNLSHAQNMQANAWQNQFNLGRDNLAHQRNLALNQQDFVNRQAMLDQGFQNNKDLAQFNNDLRMQMGDHNAQQDKIRQDEINFHQTRLKNLSAQGQAMYNDEIHNFNQTMMEVPPEQQQALRDQHQQNLDNIYNNAANHADRSREPGYVNSNAYADGIDLINGTSPGQKISVFNGTIKNPDYEPQFPEHPINNPKRIEISIPDYEEASKRRIYDASGNVIGHTQVKIDPLTGQAETIRVTGEENGYQTPSQKADILRTRQTALKEWVDGMKAFAGDENSYDYEKRRAEYRNLFPPPNFAPDYYPTEESRGAYFSSRAQSEAAEEAALRPPAPPQQQAPQAQQQQAPQIQGVPEDADDAAIQQAPVIEQGQEAEAVQQMGDGDMVRIQGPDGNTQIMMKVKRGGMQKPKLRATDDIRREAGLDPIPEGDSFYNADNLLAMIKGPMRKDRNIDEGMSSALNKILGYDWDAKTYNNISTEYFKRVVLKPLREAGTDIEGQRRNYGG